MEIAGVEAVWESHFRVRLLVFEGATRGEDKSLALQALPDWMRNAPGDYDANQT